jgi:hypothetical protein
MAIGSNVVPNATFFHRAHAGMPAISGESYACACPALANCSCRSIAELQRTSAVVGLASKSPR